MNIGEHIYRIINKKYTTIESKNIKEIIELNKMNNNMLTT